jgi:hypothetical protein
LTGADAATGQKFLARQAHIEHIRALLAKGKQPAGADDAVTDSMADAIEQLKVAQVADLLAKAAAKAGYIDDSRTHLKKLITTALADTNWRLMSEGVRHRLGYLSGRLRAYESEDELRKLVEKQIKGGGRKKPATQPAPVLEPAPRAEPPPAPKRTGRQKERAIRVVGIFHPDLHMLIPPRDDNDPSVTGPR